MVNDLACHMLALCVCHQFKCPC